MGYRSDVAIVFYPDKPEDMPLLKLFVQENLPDKFEERMRDSDRAAAGLPSYLIFRGDDLKWYDTYDDVRVYETLFDEWEDKFMDDNGQLKFHYEFVRIGEEPADVEERGTDSHILYVSRTIVED